MLTNVIFNSILYQCINFFIFYVKSNVFNSNFYVVTSPECFLLGGVRGFSVHLLC